MSSHIGLAADSNGIPGTEGWQDSQPFVIAIVTLIFAEILFLGSAYTADQIIELIVFCLLVIVSISIYSFQPNDVERVALFIGIAIISPFLSIPISQSMVFSNSIFADVFLETDRITIRNIILSVYSILLFISAILKIDASRRVLAAIFPFLLLVLSVNQFGNGLSTFQIVMDFFLLLGGYTLFLYFRAIFSNNDKLQLVERFSAILTLFILVLAFDLAVTSTGTISWTSSYREGFRGLFYGSELAYSVFLGIGLTYLFRSMDSMLTKIVAAVFGIYILSKTYIDASIVAFLLSIVITTAVIQKVLARRMLVVIATLILSTIAIFQFQQLLLIDTSIWPRIGTYWVAITILGNGAWLFGIAPGVVDLNMLSNLAISIFDSGYTWFLSGLPDVFVSQLIERSGYESGGAFLPHNGALALIASYGILMAAPALYYFFFLPFLLATKKPVTSDRNSKLSLALYLYIAAFALVHPLVLPILFVYLAEQSRFLNKL